MIEVHDLSKNYSGTQAVDRLAFTVQPGEVLGLVGPNGAGKTTTMRCIAGILQPSAGVVMVSGVDVVRYPAKAKRVLAFVPDEPRLFDYLTVREHMRFYGRVFNVRDIEARIHRLAAELELEGKEDALPGTLSRGMKQKVAIACALLHQPRVVMFDEPLTGLDPVAIRRIKQSIRELAASGAAVIISSHLLDLVEEIATTLLLMQNGRKVLHGSMEDIRGGGKLETAFMKATGHDQSEADA